MIKGGQHGQYSYGPVRLIAEIARGFLRVSVLESIVQLGEQVLANRDHRIGFYSLDNDL